MPAVYVDRTSLGLSDPEGAFKAWQVNLDRIELDVMRAERNLERGMLLQTDPWDVPADYGPLPEELRERAEGILARQRAIIQRIAETLGYTLKQQALVEAVGRTSVAGRGYPIYVDVNV